MKREIPFVKYRWALMSVSIVFAILSIISIVTKGFNYGIDFEGGAKLEYKFTKPITEGEVRDALSNLGLGEISVTRFGEAKDMRISIKVKLSKEHATISGVITDALTKKFGDGSMLLEQEETVGPKVGAEMRKKAWLTIIFSWAMMLIYIGYRFDFLFAPGAIISLVHDTLISLGFFSYLYKEFNLTILAAVLTLIGYSINDTIVVFDRIRENRSKIKPETIYDVVNSSMNSTLSRTLITSLTVFFVVVVLFFKGGGTLHDFAFMMIIGVIIGTYSSIFIASPIYIGLYNYWPKIRRLWAKH
jgi:preprotein translocase subunit SecF